MGEGFVRKFIGNVYTYICTGTVCRTMLRWRLVQDIEREHSVKYTSLCPGTYGHVGLSYVPLQLGSTCLC